MFFRVFLNPIATTWKGLSAKKLAQQRKALEPFLEQTNWGWETPLVEMSKATRLSFLRGDSNFIGLLNVLERELATTTSVRRQEQL